jgi:cytochrome c peroxidase
LIVSWFDTQRFYMEVKMNKSGKHLFLAAFIAGLVILVGVSVAAAQSPLTDKQELGKAIFFDEDLSLNENQSCATCHGPKAGWTGPEEMTNAYGAVYEGSIPGAFGDRKPPSAAYATLSPIFSMDKKGLFVGGNFWDGRATGETLGNPAAEQAKGPFLNPAEQALPDAATLVSKVCAADYGAQFREIWGDAICEPGNVSKAYDAIGLTVADYEGSPEVNAFTSKYDYSLKDQAKLTKQERLGFALFQGKGKCRLCHISNGTQPLFTDFTFDNLGLPSNPENPAYINNPDFTDPGLGGFLAKRPEYAAYAAENMGKHKVPTLRNVNLGSDEFTKAYGHNGYFKSLYGIVHFYNTRDVLPVCPGDYTEAQALGANCWPAAEVAANVNNAELGDLGLTKAEEEAIVAFLKTLDDGYKP